MPKRIEQAGLVIHQDYHSGLYGSFRREGLYRANPKFDYDESTLNCDVRTQMVVRFPPINLYRVTHN